MKSIASITPEFRELCAIEPRLTELARDIAAVKDTGKSFCANQWWYGKYGFKARMSGLVGYSAENPRLRTSEAYDVAYRQLYRLLPDCRACVYGPFRRSDRAKTGDRQAEKESLSKRGETVNNETLNAVYKPPASVLRELHVSTDCGKAELWNYYMATDETWAAADLDPQEICCFACLEHRLQRPLALDDFPPYPVNRQAYAAAGKLHIVLEAERTLRAAVSADDITDADADGDGPPWNGGPPRNDGPPLGNVHEIFEMIRREHEDLHERLRDAERNQDFESSHLFRFAMLELRHIGWSIISRFIRHIDPKENPFGGPEDY
jgi:hypothetical protein